MPDAVPADEIAATIRAAAGALAVAVELFDVYRGAGVQPGFRSLAYRVRLQATDRTLTDSEVGETHAALIAAVESTHSATLRA